jgi:excisionase family DNA binding protein
MTFHQSVPHVAHGRGNGPQGSSDPRWFCSVTEAAQIFGMNEMTLYRAIRDGQFPAVRIRGRLIIPAKAIDSIIDAAVERGRLVDASEWVAADERPSEPGIDLGRPRPGANQTGAGSPITQQGARGEVSSMPDADLAAARDPRSGETAGGVA